MGRILKSALGLGFAAVTAVSANAAQEQTQALQNLRDALIASNMRGDMLSMIGAMVSQVDIAGDGLDRADLDLYKQLQDAEQRAGRVSAILRFDLDGDLEISLDEVERHVAAKFRNRSRFADDSMKSAFKLQLDEQVKRVMKADADGNKIIEGRELTSDLYAKETKANYADAALDMATALLAADPNSDGKLTNAEMLAVLSEVTDDVEAGISQRMKLRAVAPESASCEKIAVPSGAKVIAISAYKGTSTSNVALAGQDGDTTAATIRIEDGKEPLFLTLVSHTSMVWKIDGEKSRVAGVYVSSGRQQNSGGSGVAGIGKDKIVFGKPGCPRYFSSDDQAERLIAKSVLETLLDRPIDGLVGAYGATSISIPSDVSSDLKSAKKQPITFQIGDQIYAVDARGMLTTVSDAKSGTQNKPLPGVRTIVNSLMRFQPGGVMNFNVADVHSNGKAEAYEVLPNEAGLLQLMQEGKLERTSGGKYIVRRKMRFPAGLAGAHSVSFVVPKDVPMPEGDSGHSCVFSEAEARFVSRSGCIGINVGGD